MQKRTPKKACKVDYRLLYKRKIVDFLESLKDKEYTIWQMNESMKKLFSMGEQVVQICLAKLRENDEGLAPVVCYALEYADNYDVVAPLMDILIMPDISDKVKARILTVLSHYGVDAGELPLDMIMKDFDRVASESLAEMLEDISKDYFMILYILDDMEEFPPDMKLSYVKDIGDLKDERAVGLLEIIATMDDVPLAQEAIKALGKIKSGKSLFALSKLVNTVNDDRTRKIVEREIQRLKFSGVQMEIAHPPVALDKPVKIIVSSVDGLGNRALWIAWKNPIKARKLASMNLLLNADTGIKDCWGVPQISTREFNSSVKDLAKTTLIAECNMEYAVALIKDALFLNQEKGIEIPYQFFFWKHLLEQNYNLKPKSYKPSFEKYDLEEIASNNEYFKSTFDLFNYRLFDDWFIAEPRVYDYAEENKSKKGYTIKKMTAQRAEKLFSKFTQELIEPQVHVIKRMMELSADFLDRSGQKELAKVALSALLHMNIRPLYYHPFIQRMIIESIRVALNNMKNGFDMRVNPDAFE
ncbi:MAG TPA: HEAT repeat domain-containing protein [Thermoanaerobacterales bacterium]|nr:HEAT repeat domain-containing protein [Thermoanaerobacterales bacterium]